MLIKPLLAILPLLASFTLAHPLNDDAAPQNTTDTVRLEPRGSCVNGNGGDGACVIYYGGKDCQEPLGSYHPTCNGNCFQYDNFQSLEISGSILAGTDCEYFSDDECGNSLGKSGNTRLTTCMSSDVKAKSMRCYYNCRKEDKDD